MTIRKVTQKVLAFSLGVGLVVATLVTLVITVWEWLENPSGIFHNADGTHWQFVYDTASSWFVPTFFYTSIDAALVYLIYIGVRYVWRHRNPQ